MPSVNVEKVIIGWLSANSGIGWHVFGDHPKVRPDKYILVDRTGGPRESMVLDKAEILIEVYDKNSRVDSSDKALEIADLIPQLLAVESITRAEVNSVVKLDDTIAQYFRYQIYCDIFNRRQIIDIPLEYPTIVDENRYDKTFEYSFTNQSTIVVMHNLNKNPSVRVEDTDGNDIELEIIYDNLDQLTLVANAPFSGRVYCN